VRFDKEYIVTIFVEWNFEGHGGDNFLGLFAVLLSMNIYGCGMHIPAVGVRGSLRSALRDHPCCADVVSFLEIITPYFEINCTFKDKSVL
jgi:hypothetical protein